MYTQVYLFLNNTRYCVHVSIFRINFRKVYTFLGTHAIKTFKEKADYKL